MNGKSEQLRADRALSSRIQKGDSSAWGQIYDLYAHLLYRRILMPRLSNSTAAEDALSETFKSAIEHFDQYKDQNIGLYAWLCRIAHNKAMDMHRVRSVTGRKLTDFTDLMVPLMEPLAGADDLLELRSERFAYGQALKAALESLNPRYRQALELRFLEEKSREDCAEALDVKTATFDVLLLRALRSLRKAWQASREGPSP